MTYLTKPQLLQRSPYSYHTVNKYIRQNMIQPIYTIQRHKKHYPIFHQKHLQWLRQHYLGKDPPAINNDTIPPLYTAAEATQWLQQNGLPHLTKNALALATTRKIVKHHLLHHRRLYDQKQLIAYKNRPHRQHKKHIHPHPEDAYIIAGLTKKYRVIGARHKQSGKATETNSLQYARKVALRTHRLLLNR